MRGILRFLIGLVLVLWGATRWIFGYIDPNTGGMLFQLLAILLAFSSAIILFFSRQIRVGLARISRMVRGRFPH
jgi:hypothetical protein